MKLKISALSTCAVFSLLFLSCKKDVQIEPDTEKEVVVAKNNISSKKDIDFSTQENQLLSSLYRLQTDQINIENDSLLTEITKKFSDSLVYLITKNSGTLHYPFDNLQKENAVKIATSDDNNLRIYSWDNNQGGSMRFYNQIFQIQVQNNVISKVKYVSEDAQAFFSKIYTVQRNNGASVYLAVSNSILSSKYSMQQVTAYEIKNQELQEIELFKSKNKLLSSISFQFNFFSVADRPERPIELITLDQNKLKITLVDKDLNVTNENLIYEWSGEWFNYKGVE